MKKFEKIMAKSLSALTCDCCGREAVVGVDDYEMQAFVSLDFVGGYQSVFGDGNHVTLDICQCCLKDKLGAWLNIQSVE
jgi:hypothetical protein